MATPKDKFSKALEQKAHTQTGVAAQQRSPWEEALDRHVSVPASRSLEAAEVFRGFSGSWAAGYELGMGASGESGEGGLPALQRKVNRLGQPGMPEVNFRPYDWGTHRFGPKGPSLLGHPISFSVVGPTLKSLHCDWQWALTDNSGTANGDVLTLDSEGGDDLSVMTQPAGSAVVQTFVHLAKGGATTLEDYYGFTDLSGFENGGLYLVVSMSGSRGAMTNPSGVGGVGDDVVADPTGPTVRVGVTPHNQASKTEVFRVAEMDNVAKTFTLDPVKHIADFFTITGSAPVIRAVMLIRPEATRLVAVPGSGPVGQEQTFAILPPERALPDDYNPPYLAYTDSGVAGVYDPWTGYGYSDAALTNETEPAHNYPVRPLLPIEEPVGLATAIQPSAFNGAVPPATVIAAHRVLLPLESGTRPAQTYTWGRICRIFEVEFYGSASTYAEGVGPSWVSDPGYEWLLGYHEVFKEDVNAGFVEGVGLIRTTEVNPVTGVPFFTPPDALEASYAADPNSGIRWKLSFHDPVRRVWEDPHASIDKISRARLTNLINPSWVNQSRSLKQQSNAPGYTQAAPDKAIFDTTSSDLGASGSNADPGNLMDLGFRVVLFPAKDGGAGHLVPDFDRPVSNRQCRLNPAVDEDQYWDIDYSNGLVYLSHAPAAGGDLTPNGVVGPRIVNAGNATNLSFFFSGTGFDTITRASGSWVTAGVEIGHRGTITNASNAANNGEFQVTNISPTVLTIASLAVSSGIPYSHPLTTSAGDTSAVITFGNNRRSEVVLFASCVPYSREAGQLGANIRVTGGRSPSATTCGTTAHANADVFGGRRFWRLAGTDAAPQVITSAASDIQINLVDLVSGVDLPPRGFIEIVKGLNPEGEPALHDTAHNPFSTFGYTFDNTAHGGGGTALVNCHGGIVAGGAATITVNDANPYIAVLRRDVVTPNSPDGSVGTDYAHDVTFGSAFRASTIRFKHARLTTQVDGSVVVEGLEELAGQHELLFKDLFTSNVIDGFNLTYTGTNRIVNISAGVVLIDGVRSEMAASSVTLPAGVADYYLYIEPLGGDPACPGIAYQVGLPLTQPNHVLLGYATHNGAVLTGVTPLQNKLNDINLRDDILVGAPESGQPNFSTAHPHFTELADAVAYACELSRYRTTHSDSNDAYGDRYIKIKVVGPTNERLGKLPIQFTAPGIIIEGAGVRVDGDHGAVGMNTANQMSVAWNMPTHLFDLNGQSHLKFENLVFEFRDNFGVPTQTETKISVFHQEQDLNTSFINIDNCHLVWYGDNEDASSPPLLAQAFVHVVGGSHSSWRISNCSAVTSDAGVYFGGSSVSTPTTVTSLDNIVIEKNTFQSLWQLAARNDAGQRGAVSGLVGINQAGPEIEPEPHGAVVFATKTSIKNCVVRNNMLRGWSGYGIFDNGADGNIYDGNTLFTIGDFAIWTGCNITLYHHSGSGTRIVNNVLRKVHDFPATGGGAGRRTQLALAVLAGVPAVAATEKRALVVSHASADVVVANNSIVGMTGAGTHASLYLDDTLNFVVIGNHCAQGVMVGTGSQNGVVSGNHIQGNVFGVGATVAWGDNTITGDVDLTTATDQVFSGNRVVGTFAGIGTRSVITSNRFLNSTPSSDTAFGSFSVVSGNFSVGAGSSWQFQENTVVSGNRAGTVDFESMDNIQLITGNVFRSWLATVSTDLLYVSIIGNYLSQGILFNDTSGDLQFSVISGNNIGVAGIVLDNGLASQGHSNNVITGNLIIAGDIQYAGGLGNVISDNILTNIGGYLTLGNATQPSFFAKSVVSGNVVGGHQAVADTIVDTGVAGVHTYEPSILISGASSDRNIIQGNVCSGGLLMRVGSDYSVVANNLFESGTENTSVFVGGNACTISGNLVRTTVAEDVVLHSEGDGSTITGNTITQGSVWNTGSYSAVTGNYSLLSGNVALFNSGVECAFSGNIVPNGDAQFTSAADRSTFSGNRIGGDFQVESDDCTISGNLFGPPKGNVLITGSGTLFNGNRVELGLNIGGVETVCGSNYVKSTTTNSSARTLFTGNNLRALVCTSTGSGMVASGNFVDGTLTLRADSAVVMGNRIVTNLDTDPSGEDATNYILIGNSVVGSILTAGQSFGTGRGIILGNWADKITPAYPLPGTQMVVAGNRVIGAGTDLFGVDPGNDSVGVAASASDLVNFNVGG